MEQQFKPNNTKGIVFCKKCGAQMSKKSKFCPGCGKRNKKPVYARAWFIVLMTIVAILILMIVIALNTPGGKAGLETGLNGGSYSDAVKQYESTLSPSPQSSQAAKADFTFVSGPTAAPNSFSYDISGIIKNSTKHDYTSVSVSFTLYDKAGNNIGSAFDTASNLKSGDTWKFKAMGLVDDVDEVARFELDEISGW